MTITKERLLKIQHWRETYGAGSNVMLPAEEAEELARIALASLEENEFIPKNLDKALGVVGVALPESKEEFNFQIERWIQRLIDRVIRYADEFKEQPTPVVPDERAAFNAWNNENNLPIAGVGAKNAAWLAWQARASLCGNSALNVPPERPADSSNGDDIEAWFDEGWNACRAAMLNGGKS
ncbi:protein Eaa [Salmonella enterica]|nr:protein Eaa [Salmonella enterica]EBB3988351.1 protein Eaa [Salmonella enterica]EBF9245033.1 protein Eaa [Salmonella enterica]EBM5066486.1 protein Eaa [Salmonella enterica]ECK4960281.1 protein Eaa [Salmonella enterica]